jgi:hypothetical protein
MDTSDLFGAPISTYTRAQAIEDGELVDISAGELAPLVREAGFRVPVACTRAVFDSCIALTPAARRACNDVRGRAWDVLHMLRLAVRASGGGTDRLTFAVRVVRERVRPTPTTLLAIIGPGDDGAPVMTIMFPGED